MEVSRALAKEKCQEAQNRFRTAKNSKGKEYLYSVLSPACRMWLFPDEIFIFKKRRIGSPCYFRFPLASIRKIAIWKDWRRLNARLEFAQSDDHYDVLIVELGKCNLQGLDDVVRNIKHLLQRTDAGICAIEGESYLTNSASHPGQDTSKKVIVIGILAFLSGLSGTYFLDAYNVFPSTNGGSLMLPMFQIFFLLVVLGGSVGAVVYAFMRQDIFTFVKQTAREQVELEVSDVRETLQNELRDEIKYRAPLIEILTLQGVSRSYFEIYTEDFQKIRRGCKPKNSDAVLRDISAAKAVVAYTQRAFKRNPALSAPQSEDNEELYRLRATLMNHEVYHCTAELIFKSRLKKEPSKDLKKQARDLLSRVEELDTISNDERVGPRWYEWKETVGTCKTLLGSLLTDKETEKAGKAELRRVINGNGPTWSTAPPVQWRRDCWLEHNDAFGLELDEPAE